jgi:glucosamine--fructose-6-phosphate aminotransferase (isomerizing)
MSDAYHMIGYIREGPSALERSLRHNEAAIRSLAEARRLGRFARVVVTGIGSSHTAALMAAPVFTYHCPLPTLVCDSAEYAALADRWVDDRTLLAAVSRSGERGLVVSALQDAARRGAYAVGVTGVETSLLAEAGRMTLLTQEGAEVTFPKTKSVLATAGLLMRLGLALADPGDPETGPRLQALQAAPAHIQASLGPFEDEVRALLPTLQAHEIVAVAGTGGNYGTALEGAMKLQEAAYVPTCGNSTDGLLNGPVGALDGRWLVILLISRYDLPLSEEVLRVVNSLGARSLVVCEAGLQLRQPVSHRLTLPGAVDPLIGALHYLPPLQMLAYYWTVARGMNPDAPSSMRAILDAVLVPGRDEPELRQG